MLLCLPLVTGETWFKIPEAVNIRLIGAPKPEICGKDIILYILQVLKRNTIAFERIVEFTGAGVTHLSPDTRFAVSNMTMVCQDKESIEPNQVTERTGAWGHHWVIHTGWDYP